MTNRVEPLEIGTRVRFHLPDSRYSRDGIIVFVDTLTSTVHVYGVQAENGWVHRLYANELTVIHPDWENPPVDPYTDDCPF